MFDCGAFGLRSGAHHFGNIVLHGIASVLLFLVLRQMTGQGQSMASAARTSDWRSAFVAAVFAIHPLRVESVVWIAERKDVLSGFFLMLTLAAYLYYARKPSIGRYMTMSILFAFGLMSKPMLVTLPIVLLLLDYWPLRRIRRTENGGQKTIAQLVIEKIPLFALSVGSCVATLWAQGFALGSTELLPLKWRITNAVVSYFDYIRQMFWPVDLTPFYIHPENRLELWRLAV